MVRTIGFRPRRSRWRACRPTAWACGRRRPCWCRSVRRPRAKRRRRVRVGLRGNQGRRSLRRCPAIVETPTRRRIGTAGPGAASEIPELRWAECSAGSTSAWAPIPTASLPAARRMGLASLSSGPTADWWPTAAATERRSRGPGASGKLSGRSALCARSAFEQASERAPEALEGKLEGVCAGTAPSAAEPVGACTSGGGW